MEAFIQEIITDLKQLNHKEEFISSTIEELGFVVWDRFQPCLSCKNEMVFFPLVRMDEATLTSILVVAKKDGAFRYKLIRKSVLLDNLTKPETEQRKWKLYNKMVASFQFKLFGTNDIPYESLMRKEVFEHWSGSSMRCDEDEAVVAYPVGDCWLTFALLECNYTLTDIECPSEAGGGNNDTGTNGDDGGFWNTGTDTNGGDGDNPLGGSGSSGSGGVDPLTDFNDDDVLSTLLTVEQTDSEPFRFSLCGEETFPYQRTGEGYTVQVNNIRSIYWTLSHYFEYTIPVMCIQVRAKDQTGQYMSAVQAANMSAQAFDYARLQTFNAIEANAISTSLEAKERFLYWFYTDLQYRFGGTPTVNNSACEGVPESTPHYNLLGICISV